MKFLFNRKKWKLMRQITHLQLLLEVIPADHTKYAETEKELDESFDVLRKMMVIDKKY